MTKQTKIEFCRNKNKKIKITWMDSIEGQTQLKRITELDDISEEITQIVAWRCKIIKKYSVQVASWDGWGCGGVGAAIVQLFLFGKIF